MAKILYYVVITYSFRYPLSKQKKRLEGYTSVLTVDTAK